MSINIDPVLIAAYGPGAQAAMHVASRRPDLVAGLFLFGPVVDLSSPVFADVGAAQATDALVAGACSGTVLGVA